MFKKGKRLAALCTIIFVVLSMCMPCLADEAEKTIRVDLLKTRLIMWMIMV